MTPHRALPPYDWPAVLALLHRAFADMTGRIDPPSSLHALTPQAIAQQAITGEVWVIAPTAACLFLTPRPGRLYLGKLAVDPAQQGSGHARTLITLAETRAKALGLPLLELETRVELTENQTLFQHLGFRETARKSHPGFSRPTSITYTKPIAG